MSIADVDIKKKSYPVKTSTGRVVQRSCWDVEWVQDGEPRHALFSTWEEAQRYAVNRLGFLR